MGDPICKWRNASTWTVVELVGQLPKKTMPNFEFRDFMETHSIYHKSFTKTVYQLACQLGLYYIDNDTYIPRFDHDITDLEASAYLEKWVRRYYVPNPYTARKFDNMDKPINLLYSIIEFCENNPDLNNLVTVCDSIFGETTGNILCVKYILNTFSKMIYIDADNSINVLSHEYGETEVDKKRNDKKAFFETFN